MNCGLVTGGSLRGIVVVVVRFAVVPPRRINVAFTSASEVVFTSNILNIEVFGPAKRASYLKQNAKRRVLYYPPTSGARLGDNLTTMKTGPPPQRRPDNYTIRHFHMVYLKNMEPRNDAEPSQPNKHSEYIPLRLR